MQHSVYHMTVLKIYYFESQIKISTENMTLAEMAVLVTKCYVTCGHTIFITWRCDTE